MPNRKQEHPRAVSHSLSLYWDASYLPSGIYMILNVYFLFNFAISKYGQVILMLLNSVSKPIDVFPS